MTRAAAALLAALALALTGACSSQSGDSVTDNQQNEPPQPSTSAS